MVTRILRKELKQGPVTALRVFFALWRGILIDSDFRAGCPVLAVSVEEPPTDAISPAVTAAAEAFAGWERLLVQALTEHGADPDQVRAFATLVVASAEGAIAMCRAQRSIEPLDRVAQQLETFLGTLGQPPDSTRW